MELNEEHLVAYENLAAKADCYEHQIIRELVSEIRTLWHSQRDPNYLYAGTRIHRQAILVREEQISHLQQLLQEAKAKG